MPFCISHRNMPNKHLLTHQRRQTAVGCLQIRRIMRRRPRVVGGSLSAERSRLVGMSSGTLSCHSSSLFLSLKRRRSSSLSLTVKGPMTPLGSKIPLTKPNKLLLVNLIESSLVMSSGVRSGSACSQCLFFGERFTVSLNLSWSDVGSHQTAPTLQGQPPHLSRSPWT